MEPEATETEQATPPPRNKGGRPPKLTEDLIEQIRVFVAGGNYMETAAAFAGVDRDSLKAWLHDAATLRRKLEQDPDLKTTKLDELKLKFSACMLKAFAEAEIRDVSNIGAAAAAGNWQASAWRLERRSSRRWGRGMMFQSVEASDVMLSDEERAKLSQTSVVPVGLVLPVALPPEAHEAMLEQLRLQGRLPGASVDEEAERVVREVGSGVTREVAGSSSGPVVEVEAVRREE